MKLLLSIAFSIAAAQDECLVTGDDPLNTGETPDYGGTCWDQWGSTGQIENWAEENCGENNCPGQSIPDDSCFDNPFDDIEVPILSVDNYNKWLLVNHPGDLSDLEGCEDLLQDESQWFHEDLYGPGMTCNFNIQLTYPDDGSSKPNQMSQTVLFYDSTTPEEECVGEGHQHPVDLDKYCDYCHIEESSKWIKISSNIKETHPENPRTTTNREKRDTDTMNEELGTEISDLEQTNSNTYRVLKLVKNHANRNYWRMDCLYCTMFHKAKYESTYYFEYVLETYNNYVQKLMHKTCEIYYNEVILNEIQREFDCFRAGLETDPDFCNDENELCFDNQDCDDYICWEFGMTQPLPTDCPN